MKKNFSDAPSLRESDGPSSGLTIEWLSHNRPPQCAPHPDYPTGCMMDAAVGPGKLNWGDEFPPEDAPTCTVDLPYPAECCGVWIVCCAVCGWRFGLTAAGRVDDVRRVRLPCKIGGSA